MAEMTTADGLRALADWYEAHPDIQAPNVSIFVNDYSQDAAKRLAFIAKAMGACAKDISDYYFTVKRQFGSITLSAMVSRDAVCRKIVTYDCPKSLLETLGPEFEKELAEAP